MSEIAHLVHDSSELAAGQVVVPLCMKYHRQTGVRVEKKDVFSCIGAEDAKRLNYPQRCNVCHGLKLGYGASRFTTVVGAEVPLPLIEGAKI